LRWRADKVLLETQEVPAEQEHLAIRRRPNDGGRAGAGKALPCSARLPEMAMTMCSSRGEKTSWADEWRRRFAAVLEMNLHTWSTDGFLRVDEENASAVCVIGTAIRDDLFGSPVARRA